MILQALVKNEKQKFDYFLRMMYFIDLFLKVDERTTAHTKIRIEHDMSNTSSNYKVFNVRKAFVTD